MQATADMLVKVLNELGEKNGYTTKTYNLLSVALMIKNDFQRPLKIFESALGGLNLDSEEGQTRHLFSGNTDLASLIVNYVKCSAINDGFGHSSEYYKTNPLC